MVKVCVKKRANNMNVVAFNSRGIPDFCYLFMVFQTLQDEIKYAEIATGSCWCWELPIFLYCSHARSAFPDGRGSACSCLTFSCYCLP